MRTIKRAIVIGNGFAGAENQCIGLVQALGLSNRCTLYRVTRPAGGINDGLRWLPVSVHKQLEHKFKCISAFSSLQGKKLTPFPGEGKGSLVCCTHFAFFTLINVLEFFQDGYFYQLLIMWILFGLGSDVLEADAKHIAKVIQETFRRDGPTLVIASGRDTIAVASSIKLLVPENVFLIQIQHPRSRLHRFDLVITPRHDYYPLTPEAQKQIPWFLRMWVTPRQPPDKRVVLTMGALHRVNSVELRGAASAWHDEMAQLPKPLLVVSVGGPTGRCRYGADLANQLIASLKIVLPTCGSLRISFSRRTPKTVSDMLMTEFANHPKVYVWNGEDQNPHMGHLAWADAFVITADSVSMLSEACSTGKPVYVLGAERCTWKLADFHKSLQCRGAVRPFTGQENISEKWDYPPLHDTENAADGVIEALAERGWQLMPVSDQETEERNRVAGLHIYQSSEVLTIH